MFGEPASPAALEESKPAERPAESKSRPRDRAAVLSLFGEATERTESPEAPARSRKLDLSASRLFDEDSEEQSAGRSEEQLVFPVELQSYLSPDLWRKLNSPALARGALFNALERVRSILYLVSTFMPAYLVQEKMRRPVAGLVSGQMLRGSLLFSDVSGFTPLSERLAVLGPEGAERVTAIMNQYFATMLEIISWSGGVLLKFAGDAMLVYFPEQENGAHAGWAVRAGQRMLRAMKNFAQLETPKGTVTLQMKVGLATGEFLAASVGSEKRMEYFVVGPAVTRTMAAEGKTTGGGQLVVNEATLQAFTEAQVLKSLPDGFALLQPGAEQAIDDFEIKAETRRARGAVPWNASPRAILAQIEVALRQIQALIPYLAPELVERIVAHARRRQVESEYRPTTVMFCNFTGPEVLLDTWGAVGVQRITSILNAYFSSMQEVIARYGGIISRVDPYSKGTKMLVLFGAPVAHEDDPQRAVSAALAMNAELEALEEGWRRKFARYLPPEGAAPLVQHRMGITFGQTFAGQVGSNTRREYTVMGDEVNLAARLMSAAEMGQILIEQQVQKAVADYFVLNALPPMRVKGKSKPISVFQVAGPRDDTLASRARSRGSLVGRDMELAQAAGLLEQALQGRGGLLILAGPAGIGKSHLADELVNRATRQGGRTLFIHCRSYNVDMPYSAFSAWMRSLAGITSIDYHPRVHYGKLQTLLKRIGLPESLLPTLAALMGLSRADLEAEPAELEAQADEKNAAQPADDGAFDFIKRGHLKRRGSTLELFQDLDRQRASDAGQTWIQLSAQLSERERNELYEAVWQVLARLAGEQPELIFFEDAHWMDESSKDLLRFLGQRIASIPLLLLVACRGEALVGCTGVGTTVSLAPMNQAGTMALVAHILVSDLAQVIFEQSGGTPLFIDEITRWFKRTRNISAEELRSVMQSSNILQKLILSGLETLPEMQREIARIASVVGSEFRTGEVQALLTSQVDAVTLSHHLRALVEERLFALEEAGADARYTFQQTLVRDILYNSLPYEQRRDYHIRLAEYLTRAPSGRRQAQARILAALDAGPRNPSKESEVIGYHFEQAGQWQRAAEYYRKSGDLSRSFEDYDKSITYYSQALSCLEKLSAEEITLETNVLWLEAARSKGDMALESGQYLVATSAYEVAQARLPADAPSEQATALAYRLALALPTQNRAAEALKLLQQALKDKLAGRNLAAVSTMAWLSWRAGKSDVLFWIHKAQRLVRRETGDWARQVKALLADLQGSWRTAHKAFQALENPLGAILALLRAGEKFQKEGDLSQALALYQQAAELWRKQPGEMSGLALALYQQAGVYWTLNKPEDTQRLLEEALAVLPDCAPQLQPPGRVAIQRALKTVAKGKARRLPDWSWQAFDDAFRISILFQT